MLADDVTPSFPIIGIGKIAAHLTYEMFSWYRYLIVSLFFSTSYFWSGNLFLIAHFPDLCLPVPFYTIVFLVQAQCI